MIDPKELDEMQLKDDGKPTVVCLCGSTRFMEAFFAAGWELTLMGQIVLSIGVCNHAEDHGGEALGEDTKTALDYLHKRKIDLADWILVLNIEGYWGESTRSEINYATKHGKPVRYLFPDNLLPRTHKPPLPENYQSWDTITAAVRGNGGYFKSNGDMPRLIAEVRKLREALEFYANKDHYFWVEPELTHVDKDGGDVARKALDKNAKPLADVFEGIMAEKDMTNCVDCGKDYDNHDTIDICDPCVAKLMGTSGYEVAAKWRDKCNKLQIGNKELREALEIYVAKFGNCGDVYDQAIEALEAK